MVSVRERVRELETLETSGISKSQLEEIIIEKDIEDLSGLTPSEKIMLRWLMKNDGEVVKNEELAHLSGIGGIRTSADYRPVADHIDSINRKLENSGKPYRIETYSGKRYGLVSNTDSGEIRQHHEISVGNLKLDTEAKILYSNGNWVKLGDVESKILGYLMNNEGDVILKSELADLLGNGSQIIDADYITVRVHISNIGRKLEELGEQQYHIKTHFGRGYELVANTDSSETGHHHEISVGNLKLDTEANTLYSNGNWVKLEGVKSKILEYLMKNKDEVVTNDKLAELLWGGVEALKTDYNTRLRLHISQLRGALGEESAHLITHYGVGYEWSTNGGSTTLTPKQHQLLQYLMTKAGKVCSLDEISDNVWGSDAANDTTIRTTIYTLRKKLPRDYNIESVIGPGYKLTAPNSNDTTKRNIIQFGDLSFDMDGRELTKNGEEIPLNSIRKYNLLKALVEREGKIVPSYRLSDLSGIPQVSIGIYISNLRNKLGDDGKNPKYIGNVPGVGYRIIAPISYAEPQQLKAS